jgi:hypothetical protein
MPLRPHGQLPGRSRRAMVFWIACNTQKQAVCHYRQLPSMVPIMTLGQDLRAGDVSRPMKLLSLEPWPVTGYHISRGVPGPGRGFRLFCGTVHNRSYRTLGINRQMPNAMRVFFGLPSRLAIDRWPRWSFDARDLQGCLTNTGFAGYSASIAGRKFSASATY